VLFLAVFEIWLLNIGFPIGACALLFYTWHEPLPAVERESRRAFARAPGDEPCPA
jgi:hypothetical protein